MLRVATCVYLIIAAVYANEPWVISEENIKQILNEHNLARSAVNPLATNMVRIMWDGTNVGNSAKTAMDHATRCEWKLDTEAGRTPKGWSDMGKTCGQSAYPGEGDKPPTWHDAISFWAAQASNFEYGKGAKNEQEDWMDYTQMVWATSEHVGCGWAACDTGSPYGTDNGGKWYMMVCNYCPGGNTAGQEATPYKTGTQKGSECKSNYSKDYVGLCCFNNPEPSSMREAEICQAPEPVPEPQAEPVPEPQAEPVPEPQAEPVPEPQAEPVPEPQG